MLSHILSRHPDVLSLSEFMTTVTRFRSVFDANDDFWTARIDGKEWWRKLSEPDLILDAMINAGIRNTEAIYPYGTGRFNPVSGVPGICDYVLPLLDDDPDALFDKLAAEVPGWPERSAAEHCRALFTMLSGVTGRRIVVERSGGSLLLVPILRQQFPEARFVLLHRDGADCALSMSRHSGMRLTALQIMAALSAPGLPEGASPEELVAAAPREFDGLLVPPFDGPRFASFPIPLKMFGGMWSHMTTAGVTALQSLPADQWTSLTYEDLVRSPRPLLTALAAFVGATAPPQWLDWASGFVDPGRTAGAAATLGPDELEALQSSCEPGSQALATVTSRLLA